MRDALPGGELQLPYGAHARSGSKIPSTALGYLRLHCLPLFPVCIVLPNPGPWSFNFLCFSLLSLSSCLCLQGAGEGIFKGWSVRVGHFQGTRDDSSYCPISQLLPYMAPDPFNLYLSCLLCFVGDAPYCTPEQYKECADPALGERLWLGTVRGREGNAICPMHRALRSRLDLIGQWLCFHLHLPLNAENCTFQGPCGELMRVSREGPSSSSFSLRWLVL